MVIISYSYDVFITLAFIISMHHTNNIFYSFSIVAHTGIEGSRRVRMRCVAAAQLDVYLGVQH